MLIVENIYEKIAKKMGYEPDMVIHVVLPESQVESTECDNKDNDKFKKLIPWSENEVSDKPSLMEMKNQTQISI